MKAWFSTGRRLLTTPFFSVSLVTHDMKPSLRVQIPLSLPRKRAKNRNKK
jgi:hypothetical protein